MSDDRLAHRKSSRRLRILYPNGSPAANQPIDIRQTRHAFLFGCGAFDAVALANAAPGDPARDMLEDRLSKWLEIFNYGTLPFYWGRFEPEQGNPHTDEILRAARWLNARGVAVKGHPLCWHTVSAPWLLERSNAEILDLQLARIRRDVADFAGEIDMWDVINEVVIMPIFDKYDNGITRICKELHRVPLIKEVFAAAREANPRATLLLNDFNTSIDYEILIDGCLAAGVQIDAIGIQSHQHQGYWGADKLHAVLERFSSFKLPIHFTENTIISGAIMPAHIEDLNDYQVEDWPTTPEGEDRQARELSDMINILFAHPLVEAFTIWDHADGKWLNAPSGIIRRDNTEKPAHYAMRELVKGAWSTHESAHTDSNGELTVSGFQGDYMISCGDRTAGFSLRKGELEPLDVGLSE
ncbi:MAG: endo-1,4-beta-xylanase [Oscillospiraceae bacterium]|nr:endo-1,4-beta-xylanase [Oscillospiraceae bacterium]